MENSKLFKLNVISPERVFYEGDVEMVELKTTEGELGVYKKHIPLTAILSPGVLKIHEENDEIKKAALHEGIVRILGDSVTILAESCEWPEEIDINRAKEAKIRAERRLKSAEAEINISRAELALTKSLLRIEMADKK